MAAPAAFLFEPNDVSRETMARLLEFSELVQHWTRRINLVSTSDRSLLWDRHIRDSAQLFNIAQPNWRLWLDFGSGAGFPGIVIAIMAQQSATDRRIVLVESDLRKATFLRTAIRQFQLNAVVHANRIADIAPQNADVISARALAALPTLIGLAQPHLSVSGVCLFPKGRQVAAEIEAARREWRFDLTSIPSRTDPDATILRLKGLARA